MVSGGVRSCLAKYGGDAGESCEAVGRCGSYIRILFKFSTKALLQGFETTDSFKFISRVKLEVSAYTVL